MLTGTKVLEVGGIGPLPHAGMLLASMGADVVRIERPGDEAGWDGTRRGRRLLTLDLKRGEDLDRLLELAESADVLLEGFRPGVAERIGFGPAVVQARNPGLVYGRMTGWGQEGPWAARAGHDINYLGLTGALHAIGGPEQPIPPLNLLGDFGAGSTYLVLGVLAALAERGRTGRGAVLDAAIVDGTCSLMQLIWSLRQIGRWGDERGEGMFDGGMPYYRTYRCADGGWMAVGALEPAFYQQMLKGLGLSADELPDREDQAQWPALTAVLQARFESRPRAHWEQVFEHTDACVTPVLRFEEVPAHPHLAHRRSVVQSETGVLAGTAPRRIGDPVTTLPASVATDAQTEIERWRRGPDTGTV